MIKEKIPAISDLSPEEKAQLATELWEDAHAPVPPAHVSIIEEREARHGDSEEGVSREEMDATLKKQLGL